jgi:hypothetical protein
MLALVIVLGLLVPAVHAQNSIVLSASTDKSQYNPGDTVVISGKVLDNQSNPVAGASVSLQVDDPPIHISLVISDQSGAYSDQFVIDPSSPPGTHTIYISAGKSGYDTAQQQLQFTVSVQTTTTAANTEQSTITITSMSSSTYTTSTITFPQTKCFIATATFGSELSPEVVLLRSFRDSDILRTSAGRSFMMSFNAFYYSFSPQVASVIAPNPSLKDFMKAAIYPIIAILSISKEIFNLLSFNGEVAVTFAGIFAALGIGFVYVGPMTIAFRRRWTKNCSTVIRIAYCSCALSLLILLLAEVSGIFGLLMISSVSTVLSFSFLGAVCALRLSDLLGKRRIVRS